MQVDHINLSKFTINPTAHEFQEICQEAVAFFGKHNVSLIYSLPHRKGITNQKLRHALEVCKQKNIKSVKYLLGILRNV